MAGLGPPRVLEAFEGLPWLYRRTRWRDCVLQLTLFVRRKTR